LNQGIDRKLTLISAPAGFGKTTLLSEWIRQSNRPVAWVSLDKGDNDQTSFLVYLVAALLTIEAGHFESIQTMLQAPQPSPLESVLTELINEIASVSQDFVLILDDYHVIETQPIHDALAFLLEHLPPLMHLVIASRSDPLIQTPRLRAHGQMTELRAEDLRFSAQEATLFLNQVMGLSLSEADVSALESRTEGWIAGLQLAALSMQGHMQSGEDTAAFISAFTGDDRYIVDYLVDEVLAQRPEGTQDFLLQTSILDRMTGSLCDAVTCQEGGQNVLEMLEQTNLFIVPLDNRRQWYRYHHLFAELLRQRFEESTTPEETKLLHQRASLWYEENNFLVESVEHSLVVEDYENVFRLIGSVGGMELLMRSQATTMLRWQAELPQDMLSSQPKLCMIFAWAWVATGHPTESERCLQVIEQTLGAEMEALFSEKGEAQALDPTIRAALVEIAVVRAELAIERGDIPEVLNLSNLVLSYLEEDEGTYFFHPPKDSRMVILFIMGLAYKIRGELSQADSALSEAAALGQELGNVHVVSGACGRLASVQNILGHLRQAIGTCHQGLQLVQELVGERSPMSGLIHAELGHLLYEQNYMQAAIHHLQQGIDLPRSHYALYCG
jgi:LuxR family maltose regulon positive regulatory protein